MRLLGSQIVACVCGLALSTLAADDMPSQVEKPTESIPRGGCVTDKCHPGIKSEPWLHSPVVVDACDACHEEVSPKEHTYKWRFKGKELCRFCHRFQTTGEYIHKPVSHGECTDCHNPHGGEDQNMLLGGAGAKSCLQCHSYVTEGLPAVHGPVLSGSCTVCHRAHSSNQAALLTKPGRELCLECHALLSRQTAQARTVHKPVNEDCRGCHLPHAAEDKMLLKASSPALCGTCHEKLTARIETAATKHNAVAIDKGCQNCHEAHASDYPAILVNDMVEVCLSCHDEEMPMPDGTILTNIKAVLALGRTPHGPIAQRNCVACHHIHGGSYFRLLIKEYPPEFYAPFLEETYALCMACHDRQRFLVQHTDTFTDFRNGDLNLHYLHINKKIKGRTCRACHETHASESPKHMRKSVPFGSGGWELPVDFEKFPTGGACKSGCHRPYAYDRKEPLVYELPPEPANPPGDDSPEKNRKEANNDAESIGP
ncbi:MAG: hypothetical protein JSU63_04195 [Phycisphaerales bacterium]|nr:MAG: hypothetical protein JSU63_04195 [Phycisphaerales bacterium]